MDTDSPLRSMNSPTLSSCLVFMSQEWFLFCWVGLPSNWRGWLDLMTQGVFFINEQCAFNFIFLTWKIYHLQYFILGNPWLFFGEVTHIWRVSWPNRKNVAITVWVSMNVIYSQYKVTFLIDFSFLSLFSLLFSVYQRWISMLWTLIWIKVFLPNSNL